MKKLAKDNFREIVDHYLSKWKFILLCLFISIAIAFLHLRYATYEYVSTASIKLKDDKKNNKLSEITSLQEYGLFSNNATNVQDEIKIITSRNIISKVVQELNLNIKYYVSGRLKEQEVYKKPPINLNFLVADSILHKTDTIFYLTIIDKNTFSLSNEDRKNVLTFSNSKPNQHAFGELIKTSIGDLIITPNLGNYGTQPNDQIKIKITPINQLVETYSGKIKVSNIEKSNILNLSLNENIKEKAEDILNELIEEYNKDAVKDKEKVVEITSDFINNRLQIVSNELEQVDLTAENLKKNNRLSDLGTQSNIFLQSERETEQRLVETTNQIQLIDYMSSYINDNKNESDLLPANIGIEDNNVAQITQSYNELVMQRDRILRNSSEKNPTVINLNNQIKALRSNLNQSLQNLKSSSKITLNALKREDARISSKIFSTPKKERQFRNIERQQSIKESLYLYLLEKREETAITLGMSSPNAKIVETAYTSSTPVAPRKKLTYLTALILGLFIPISIIYVKDLMDTTIHSKSDIEPYITAPFIGDIPKSNFSKRQLIQKIDYSPKAEAFRIVRSNIDFMLKNKKGCKTIFITSTIAQEGKSHTSVNLAKSFSFSGKKVLLIEADIRVPKVNQYFEIDLKPGLTDYISDTTLNIDDIIIQPEETSNLNIVLSGTIPPNPAELLMNERIELLFKGAKEKYDYIIVDTAAVGLVTDTLLISDFADMFIYVVSANKIDKRHLHIAQKLYEDKRLPNMTVLINGTIKQKGYGYGYGNKPVSSKKRRKNKLG